MKDIDMNNPKISSSGCVPALTVVKIDSVFKRMLETLNEELGDDKEKITKWEENIRKRFNL